MGRKRFFEANYQLWKMELFGSPTTNSNPEDQFYQQLFRSFDPQNFGTVQGGQVFGFFLSSGLNKAALGDIWDEATQKQSGGLSVAKFINAMKLISLAQKGIAPKLGNIGQNGSVPIPQMKYPSHIQPPQPSTSPGTAKKAPSDPFGGLTQGLGFDAFSTPKPNQQTIDMPQQQQQQQQQSMPMPMQTIIPMSNPSMIPMNNSQDQIHPNEALSVPKPKESEHEIAAPSLNRRISTKILYQEERLREQIRQAEQREKLAKKQANTQRIENERLERENEALKIEINTARQAQADALKQSQDALNSVQPLRMENEKLKQAIAQWKELITAKDEELEALEADVDLLRLENEKLENALSSNKSSVDDAQFRLERSDALLKELKIKNKEIETRMSDLKEDKLNLEDEKRSLDLKVAQLKDEIKKLKKHKNSGLGLDKTTLMEKEANFLNVNDMNLSVSKASPSASIDNSVSATSAMSDDDETGVVQPGAHDFNFSEMTTTQTTTINNNEQKDDNDNNDNDNDNNNEEEEEEDADDNEPDFIEQEIVEQIEIEEDVIKTVLIDDEYKNDEWYMSNAERKSYCKYFKQADANQDGVVDGGEANKFFTKSKLNRKLLAKLWSICDQKKQSKLNEPMFCAMFHLVMKIKKSGNKLQVPSALPQCLKVEVIEKLGTKIQKTVKEKKIISQTKMIKVENPNKHKRKKKKNKKKKVDNQMDFGNDDWGNGFSFDTTESTETKQNGITSPPQKNESVTKDKLTQNEPQDDDNWNAFGNFFDDQ